MEKFVGASSDNSKKETPQFIREFSRDNSQEERDEMAAAIREKRKERDAFRVEQTELTAEQEKLVAELNELKGKIEEYNSAGFLHKITDYLEYRQLQGTVAKQLEAQGDVEQAIQELGETPAMFEEPKKMLTEFYQGERQKWAEAGYDTEDIKKYFSEENLSKLSVEEYALLLQRFPGEMVTHLTRQGVRDHASASYHTAGVGEFHKGFESILEDKRLHSSLSVALKEHSVESAIAEFIQVDKAKNREQALTLLKHHFDTSQSFGSSVSDSFADNSAVHFACEEVVDTVYGGEKGNEIFFAYPVAHVASQLHYTSFTGLAPNQGAWNDVWVYPDTHKGMNVDAGLVFIPEETQVDIATGSKYKINENGEPIIPQKRLDEAYNARFEKLGFIAAFVQQLPWQTAELATEEKEKVMEDAFKRFDITDSDLKKALHDEVFLKRIANMYGAETEKDTYKDVIKNYFDDSGSSSFELAENTVSSKEYWENYFTQYPEKRPTKVVYYKGENPTKALNDWQSRNRITKKGLDKHIGFPESDVTKDSPEANQDKGRFYELALKVIDDRFPESDEEAAARMASEEEG